MRMVVDSNFLQTDKLKKYLSKENNIVVLTDQVSYEAFSSDIYKSFRILSFYPDQVLVLKRTETILKLSLKSAGLQKRIIDSSDTKRFRGICKKIQNESKRDVSFIRLLTQQKNAVQNDLSRINNEAEKMSELILDYFSSVTKSEAKALRAGPPYKGESLDFILNRIKDLTLQLFAKKVNFIETNNYHEFYNSYLFRSGVCGYFLAQEWYLSGGLKNVKPKTMMNDLLDMQIAAYATFFDGFLSNDKKAVRIYKIANDFINSTIKS
jgi:hypothetical protein